jgi:RNA polymerase sigma factor (sigma-70 family)
MEVSALTHPSRVPGLRGPSPLLRLQSDERLIALTRRGQHAAFETLFSRYHSRLLAFCRHMLSSREDAEDVLQEVFAAAFNAVLADEREINVRPWLYRIARNRSLNHLRRASATGVDSMDVHYAEHGLSTGDRVLRRESFRELIADVHELPETQRTALLLREIDALSYEQIAHAMETTVPSVKSLLVRARISLAEAAEARKLSCEEVRLELGEAAEGLVKLSPPARRHVRGCERCRSFKQHLKENNHALAAIMPVAPLLLLKRLLLTKLGSTASAGGAHVAGGAGVGAGAGATVGAGASATVGAGAVAGAGAAGGTGMAGGLLTAGAGAIATKAVAGLAAAAIVTAGAVAADHAVSSPRRHLPAPHPAYASATTASYAGEPQVVREQAQPLSTAAPVDRASVLASATRRRRAAHRRAKLAAKAKLTPAAPAAASSAPAVATAPPAAADAPTGTSTAPPASPTPPATQPTGTQVTEVTTETTQLPAAATDAPQPSSTVTTPVAGAPTSTTTPPSAPAGETAPAAPSEAGASTEGSEPGGPAISSSGSQPNSGASGPAAGSAEGSTGAVEGSTGGTEVPTARIVHDVEGAQAATPAPPPANLAEGKGFERPREDPRRADFHRRGDF